MIEETPPSGPLSPSRPPAHKTPWPLLGVGVSLAFVTVVGVVGWRLLSELRRLRGEQVTLEQQGAVAQQQMHMLEQRYTALAQEHQQLGTDRNNLLEQAKRAIQGRDQAEKEHQLLEQVFRNADAERLSARDQLRAIEEEHAQLLQNQTALLGERAALQQQLENVRTRTEEKRLKGALTKEQHERKALAENLRQTQSLAGRLKAERSHVDKELVSLQKRLDAVQQQHAKLLGEHRTLKKQSEQVPGNVTKLAREHERLVKDLADTHYNMGVMFGKRRDYARAATGFRRVVELRPEDAEAHYNLGVIYAEHLPDREKAIAFFRKYLAVNPSGSDASYAKQYIATWQAWEAKERLE